MMGINARGNQDNAARRHIARGRLCEEERLRRHGVRQFLDMFSVVSANGNDLIMECQLNGRYDSRLTFFPCLTNEAIVYSKNSAPRHAKPT